MSIAVLVLTNVVLVAVAAVGLGLCYRELRALRRGLGALDEGEGRRAAAMVGGLQVLKEPLDAIRVGVEELSPNRRATLEHAVPSVHPEPTPAPASAGLRLPRAADEDRDSDGETRLVRQPTAAELRAAGAVPALAPPRPRGGRLPTPQPPRATLRAVCRMCEGGGTVRTRAGSLEPCGGCKGTGYVDPQQGTGEDDGRAALMLGVEEGL